ncbi:MAG: hypothetical protein H6706_06110 [Myxococcales bacterium]|nr:hypothetical protein [Myxococcales bacterium]
MLAPVRSDRIVDAALAVGLISPRALRPAGWIRGQRCPSGCDGGRPRQGACNYAADGGRFHCHRCGLKGDFVTWLLARGETPDRYADTPPAPPRVQRGERLDVAAAWAGLQASPGRWRDAVGAWARDVRGWPPDLVAGLVGQGARPPVDDVAGFATGRLPGPTLTLVERARRLGRHVLLALRDADGQVRSVHLRHHTAEGRGQKTLALPQWLTGPSAEWGGLSLFGRLDAAVEAARRRQVVLLVEGGPDYLVAAALARLGLVGAALGAPSCGELPRLGAALAGRLADAGLAGEIGLIPHRGDADQAGVKAMVAARTAFGPRTRAFWVPVPLDADGRGDLASAAASVRSAQVLAALVLAARTPSGEKPRASG